MTMDMELDHLPCGCLHNGNSISKKCEPHSVLEILSLHKDWWTKRHGPDSLQAKEMGRAWDLVKGWIDSEFKRAEDEYEHEIDERAAATERGLYGDNAEIGHLL